MYVISIHSFHICKKKILTICIYVYGFFLP
nr:MAG TPA: hypothetical protein [Caudoviricetes sp.]